MIKCLILDRDNTLIHGSRDAESPFYYILKPSDIVIKPTVREAMSVLDVLQRSGLKVYMATKQRCISKGLITRQKVDDINRELERKLNFVFDGIYVEEEAADKRLLFASILRDSKVKPSAAFVIDDSPSEIDAARSVNIHSYHMSSSPDLYTVLSGIL